METLHVHTLRSYFKGRNYYY